MIDKPDPAKDAGRTDGPGAKRPHATLDLKATEVKPPAPAASASSSAGPTGPAASSAGTSSAGAPSAGSSSSAAGAASSSKPAGWTEPAGKGAPASAAPKPAPAAAKPEPKPDGGSGGGFFSHLAAGVIGGALVYAGAAFLGPSWLPSQDGAALLSARISALEQAPKEGTDLTSLTAKVADAESRTAKIDELERTVTALRDAQGALQAETKSLGEAAQTGGAGSAERLAKLEEQLAMIAAGSAGSDGRVPQLAAISGKVSDVETSLAAQIAEVRKSLPAEVDQRLAAVQEASEAAKAATLRLDRELSQVRTEQARGTQKADTAKADTDRLTAAIEAVKEETGRLTSTVGELRSSVDSQLKQVARPADVAAAVGPVNSKLAELEQNVQGVVKSEQSRRQNAERIVLSLELSNLKRALDRGQGSGYATELEEAQKASAGQLDLSPLVRFKDTGIATPAQLKAEFRPLINAVLDADTDPADGSVIDRLLSGAKSVVRVRKISHEADDTSTEAVVSRIEAALNEGRLGDVLTQAKALPERARTPIEDWLIKVTARASVDQAIAAVEERLKASLSGAPEPEAPAAPAATPAPEQK